ncbi:MAG TPA: FHA domain-containing protein [Baekduia sp.]|nr:FHA domain-containing protein [Baekduia sp.]
MSAPTDASTTPLPPADPLAPFAATPAELKRLIATERAQVPFVAVRDAASALALYVLHVRGGEVTTIGRRGDSGIPLPWDAEVSGLHAEIEEVGGVWTLSDDGLSTNGTFVNGRRVAGRRRLVSGDRIRAGRTLLAFSAPDGPSITKTLVAGRDGGAHLVTDAERRVLVALCRPYLTATSGIAAPASNQQIADEVFLAVDTVKRHLRSLFAKFKLDGLPQNRKRAKLAEEALHHGVVSAADLRR